MRLLNIFVIFMTLFILLGTVSSRKRQKHKQKKNAGKNKGQNKQAKSPDVEEPYSGQRIRLGDDRNLNGYNDGLLEVYRGGTWGIVCDDGWDEQDADVACRELGFSMGAKRPLYRRNSDQDKWQSTSFLINNVACQGNEKSLLSCPYSTNTECQISEAVSVTCATHDSKECGKPKTGEWIPGEDSCYMIKPYRKGLNMKKILKECVEEQENAYLAVIETEAEHNFVSNLLTKSKIDVTRAFLSSKLSKKKGSVWKWQKYTRKLINNKKWRGALQKKLVKMNYKKWFPGWVPTNFSAEPSKSNGKYQCLTLSNSYRHPSKRNKVVDFYYFDSAPCKPKKKEESYFICETRRQPSYVSRKVIKECYKGSGESYRGTTAVTKEGTPCIKWTLGSNANPWSHPGTGLGDHNYCRNPDGDKQPWCWVEIGTNDFGFCEIPECNKEPVTTTTVAPLDCPRDQFYCYNHRKSVLYTQECISGSFHCDNEKDCDEGEDELDCDYKIPSLYTRSRFRSIRSGDVKEKYLTIALEYCARLCLETTSYVCRSITYVEDQRECFLSDKNSVTTSLSFSLTDDYYELISQKDTSCIGEFKCKNSRCIELDAKCDSIDDCLDFSDEDGCDGSSGVDTIEIRLADGEDQHSGRVEVNYRGEWGVICDDNWDIKDAFVVCRMLGYNHALSASGRSKFGGGNKNFLLDEVNCYGNETSLLSCDSNPWKEHDCKDYEVAGVYCRQTKACNPDEFTCSNGHCIQQTLICNAKDDCFDMSDEKNCDVKIKLVNGTIVEGRVEIMLNGISGTVCDDGWDDAAATVVCRMLGYNNGIAKGDGIYGKGTGPIWLDNVECDGTETSIELCNKKKWGHHDCDHSEDAGVICTNTSTDITTTTTENPSLSMRVALSGNTSNEGRIILIVNGKVGSICNDKFDDKDAAVVCRMMGFHSGKALASAASIYGEGKGEIWVDDLACTGTETTILQCPYTTLHDCTHSEDAGVRCSYEPGKGIKVELVGGDGPHEGRIKVTVNGTTGGICNDDLTNREASVICRSLGFSDVAFHMDLYSRDTHWLAGLHCLEGSESSLDECVRTFGNLKPWWSRSCSRFNAAGLSCVVSADTTTTLTPVTETSTLTVTQPAIPDSVKVQLTGGDTDGEGNVLLLHGGKKGVICDDMWDDKDATVVCRMLGYSYGNATQESTFGINFNEIWLDDVECTGDEVSIFDCHNNGWKVNDCGIIREVAGVKCFNEDTDTTDVRVSLVGGSFEGEGRVEVSRGDMTGTICDDYWDSKDAKVVCSMLGYKHGISVTKGAYGEGTGSILLDNVQCQGTETNIKDCVHQGWGNSNCGHSEDAGVICGNLAITRETTVELVGGKTTNEGRVEIIHKGVRGTVCGHNFDVTKATVLCRMLGFSAGKVQSTDKYSPGTGMIWAAEKWECIGTEDSVKSCENFPGVNSRCDHTQDVGLYCYDVTTTTPLPTTTTTTTKTTGIQIELVNGNSPNRGRVEIIRNGVRGTVCDDRWDNKDAAVICRMLGYKKGGKAVSEARYGAGSGKILLDDVQCDGTESSIADCVHDGWGVSNCHHTEDAGVQCIVETQPSKGDWYANFSPDCGKRPKEDKHIRKKRETLSLGGATVGERPQPAKIVYGTEAEYGMYPWQVGVRKVYYYDYFTSKKISDVWCGATILNKYWILSAAHCFDGIPKSKITLRTGDHNHKYKDDHEQEFDAETIIMHEDYDSDTYENDIALIKLSSDDGDGIHFNDYVQPACLPTATTSYRPGTLCHISGWGKTEHGVSPNVLRKEKVPLMSDSKCRSLYKVGSISPNMLCAGYEEGGIDTCQGDSGGPLVCEIDGKYTVLGATSWGNGCGSAGYPGVYAHVKNLLQWITDQLKKYN